MQTQLQSVDCHFRDSSKRLAHSSLHLRPIELEQKSLVEGGSATLKELEEKKVN